MNNIERVKYLRNLETERKILQKNMNLYYFQKDKRKLIFSRLEKIEKEIERVEKFENNWKKKNKNP